VLLNLLGCLSSRDTMVEVWEGLFILPCLTSQDLGSRACAGAGLLLVTCAGGWGGRCKSPSRSLNAASFAAFLALASSSCLASNACRNH
jgi:hypothetical protein